jgi:glucose 1-dehydrogenase
MKGLQGKVALVTGGSSGIGQAIAIRLGADGASVAINYVGRSDGAVTTKEAIEHGVEMCMKQVAEAGGRPILVGADVSDEHDVEQMFDRVMSEYGRLDILINNAGIQIAQDSHELSAADFDKILAVNLRGAFLCARQAVRSFLAADQPGVIVNVSSVHQVIPKPRFLGYSVSKGGMQNLTRSLALEYAARGIRVNGIGPGATVTPINRSWIDDPVKRRMVESHIPMRRAGDSAEMAAAAAFLCSDEAAYITGQTLFVDGGLTLYPSFETTWSSELRGAVPQEKEPVLLAQRPDLPARPGRQGRAGQDPPGIAPGQQRGHGEAQFIQQACRRELPVQGGATLREHAGVSAFGQRPERGRQVNIPLPGDDHVGEVGGLLALVRRRFGDGDHDRRRVRGGEEGGIPVEPAGTGEHRHGNGQWPVMFRANGSGRDEHDICLGAEYREQRLVGGAAQAAGHAGNRGGAVNTRDHVEPHRGPRPGRRQIAVQCGRVNRVAGKWQELPHQSPPVAGGPRRGP